ncbi:shikimate dehydrogenase family protein [Agrobacterium fabrum]|uniref:shikimate dehydrogenase family protein n=1 Tax=Agrobacterium fabrum TaxID=1176649 RepID=UPI001573EB99|nr:ThiF family adenylyltransferase [Agrobacterium fabrum]WCK80186.1 ThiF family adenylyltransferase [Agrobacterium fabrum]
MRADIPNLDGNSRIYAVFGDPIYQVQTPRLINPIFAAADANIYAVPFLITAEHFASAWDVFAAIPNLCGISTTIPHKVAAAERCSTLTPTAKAVGAVNCVQRDEDGQMNGALFDGVGFVEGLGEAKARIRDARVLIVGAGGAGRAIAFALADEGVGKINLLDLSVESVAFTTNMVNTFRGEECARSVDGSTGWDYDIVINASPIGVKGDSVFPMPTAAIRPEMLVADIASLSGETTLLRAAKAAGATVSDGNDMLLAQIRLMAGFAAGLPAGTPL